MVTQRTDTPLWLVLKNAHRLFKRHAQFRSVPLWGFVSELTGHGSTVSSEICVQFGWNPDEFTAKAELAYPQLTNLQKAVIEHDRDMARLDRNTVTITDNYNDGTV